MFEKGTEISVVMSVYNGEKYLKESIESILSQTFTGFEFIIINDGSNDSTEEIILSYRDSRIVYVKNETNLKLIASLNKGMAMAGGKYIARMDDDDIALPERFATQYKYLENNQHVDVCDSGFIVFDETRERVISRYLSPEQVKVDLLFRNPIRHSAIMMRKSLLDKYGFQYDPYYIHSEDHHFWAQVACVGNIVILEDILMRCRSHNGSVREIFSSEMFNSSNNSKKFLLKEMNKNIPEEDLSFHCTTFSEQAREMDNHPQQTEKWFLKLIDYNKTANFFDENLLSHELKKIFLVVCNSQFRFNWKSFLFYGNSSLRDFSYDNWKNLAKFFVKSLLFKSAGNVRVIEIKDKWFK